MADPADYQLRVTAGPSYASSTHSLVRVNSGTSTRIRSAAIDADVQVRIRDYGGLPRGSPATTGYFEHARHQHDLYSIALSFVLAEDVGGDELVFGNDFARPIRDNLPPGFNAALRFVQWTVDPGIDGDVYAEKPYLYGPVLSSMNVLSIGEEESRDTDKASGSGSGEGKDGKQDEVLEEGAQGSSAAAIRSEADIPSDSAARMKHFLTPSHRAAFTFSKGRRYACDFFNPYLDFNQFALRLPVVTLHLMKFWDGQPLRYVLKQRSKDKGLDRELVVIEFALVPRAEAEADERKWAASNPRSDSNSGSGSGPAKQDEGSSGTLQPGKQRKEDWEDQID